MLLNHIPHGLDPAVFFAVDVLFPYLWSSCCSPAREYRLPSLGNLSHFRNPLVLVCFVSGVLVVYVVLAGFLVSDADLSLYWFWGVGEKKRTRLKNCEGFCPEASR